MSSYIVSNETITRIKETLNEAKKRGGWNKKYIKPEFDPPTGEELYQMNFDAVIIRYFPPLPLSNTR